MKQSCLYFDKKYKCVSFIVHYTGLTLNHYVYNVTSLRQNINYENKQSPHKYQITNVNFL